ncbi:MAG: HesA/MoeB/ThiF family protein [Gammaproteobacteria bacterium]|nr:HesA/MoeB/ThiF family protein [Gammaproteobacteria bacterium]
MLTDIRYSRQVALSQWGSEGQQKLAHSHALIIGLGGLGNPVALYLACAGIGKLTLNDFDRVDVSNLPRQVLFSPADAGKAKVDAARQALRRHNADCDIVTLDSRLQDHALDDAVAAADVVIDGCDNFATRFAVNASCVRQRIPLVSGAVIRFEAQLAVFRADLEGQPCYRCLYDENAETLEDCEGQGVLSPLAGMIGTAMAIEACRVIVGFGTDQSGSLLVHDALGGQWRRLRLSRDPSCPVCGQQ